MRFQFRTKTSLKYIAQSVVEKIASQHFALYLNSLQESPFKCRSDATLMVRNFNFPMPNAIQVPRNRINVSKMECQCINIFYSLTVKRIRFYCLTHMNHIQVTFNPIDKEHFLTNSTYSTSNQSYSADTSNSCYTNSSTTTSSSMQSELFEQNSRITPYVNFIDYYKNVEFAKKNGTLPSAIQFD